jgi:phenylalanyl-tRNA synthetase beta chain
MANVIFSRKEFEKNIKLTDEIIEKISLFGTPLERIDDEEIEIEIFPNRPDLLSFANYLASFKQFLGKSNRGIRNYKIKNSKYKIYVDNSVKNIRPLTACAVVKNLKFDDEKIKEIIDIQEKLHNTLGRKRKKLAIGIYPLEKIKFPITYKAEIPDKIKFQPLEFPKELTGKQILSQHPTGREYGSLLEGLDKYPIFIDANNEILSMPPIINSHKTGKISEETKEVFIECSGFNFEILKKCLNIVVTTLAEMGGEIYQCDVQYSKSEKLPDFKPEKMSLKLENVNKLLGFDLNEKELSKLIEKMGHFYKKGIVEVAPWRVDILHEVDLIEEIAIAYGYDKIFPEIPNISTIGKQSKKSEFKSLVEDILTGAGLMEISSYHLIKDSEVKKYKLSNLIEVEDSKTDYKFLRPNLFISAMRILGENVDVSYPQEIFEIGNVFQLDGNCDTQIRESFNLMISLAPGNFTKLKQILDYFARMLNINFEIKEPLDVKEKYIEGRVGEVFFNGKSLGYFGEVHPRILNNSKIKMPVSFLEIELDKILNK